MSPRAKRIAISAAIGAAVTIAATLPVAFAEFLLLPGMFLSSFFWPQGIHSDRFLGPIGVVLYICTIYLGTAAVWGALAYAILKRRSQRRF